MTSQRDARRNKLQPFDFPLFPKQDVAPNPSTPLYNSEYVNLKQEKNIGVKCK